MQAATGDPDEQARAEKLYREAAESSPRARARLGKWLAAKPGGTDAEHREAEQLLTRASTKARTAPWCHWWSSTCSTRRPGRT